AVRRAYHGDHGGPPASRDTVIMSARPGYTHLPVDLGRRHVPEDPLVCLSPSQHGTAGSLALHPWVVCTWVIHRGGGRSHKRKEPAAHEQCRAIWGSDPSGDGHE